METTEIKTDSRVEMSVGDLKNDFARHLRYTLAKGDTRITERDQYTAFAYAIRDRIVERWISTQEEYDRQNTKRVYYLSLEFLIGRLLGNNVINLKADNICRDALKDFGID
jgi:starch phosphorylase